MSTVSRKACYWQWWQIIDIFPEHSANNLSFREVGTFLVRVSYHHQRNVSIQCPVAVQGCKKCLQWEESGNSESWYSLQHKHFHQKIKAEPSNVKWRVSVSVQFWKSYCKLMNESRNSHSVQKSWALTEWKEHISWFRPESGAQSSQCSALEGNKITKLTILINF